MYSVALGFGVGTIHTPASCKRKSPTNIRVAPSLIKSVMISYQAKWYLEEKLKKNLSLVKKSKYEMRFLTVFIQWFLYQCNQKYLGVQSWKAAHLPTLEIRVKQKRNWVKKGIKMGENRKKKKILADATGNRTRDLSITDLVSVLTNQVHLKIQFRHRFDQKCSDSLLHRLGSRFARTSSVPLEINMRSYPIQ